MGNRPFVSRHTCQTVYFISELIKSENVFKALQRRNSLISDLNWMEEMQE